MGVTTDAILCYGIQITDDESGKDRLFIPWLQLDDDEDDSEKMEFSEYIAKLIGLEPPEPHFNRQKADKDPSYDKAWGAYWTKQAELEKEIGVELVYHGHSNFPEHILAVTESVKKADRGKPIEFGQSINAPTEWREKIRSFCERAGINFVEPRFILCINTDF